jgi:hypothetical protein
MTPARGLRRIVEEVMEDLNVDELPAVESIPAFTRDLAACYVVAKPE